MPKNQPKAMTSRQFRALITAKNASLSEAAEWCGKSLRTFTRYTTEPDRIVPLAIVARMQAMPGYAAAPLERRDTRGPDKQPRKRRADRKRFIRVRENKTKRVEHQIDVTGKTEQHIAKALAGLDRKVNAAKFFVEDSWADDR